MPVKIKTDGSFAIVSNQLAICDFGQDEISCSQPIDMHIHLIKNVKGPVKKFDAGNKAPNIAMTDHILFTFPAVKAFAVKR